MDVYVDATTLISLGNVGELELLRHFYGDIHIPKPVQDEITSEPAASAVNEFLLEGGLENCDIKFHEATSGDIQFTSSAKDILDENEMNGDVAITAACLEYRSEDSFWGVVSDDRRVRMVAKSLGATVTGTIGVVVRAVHEGMSPDEAKELVRRLDSQGLHMTGELRETAYRLVDEAAKEREE
jgi:predicted nucleic acid-binding protein